MTPHLKCLNETVQMRGHNIWFQRKIRKNILQLSSNTPTYPEICCYKPPNHSVLTHPCYITELHNDVRSLLRCGFTEDHTLYPLGKTIEQCYRPLQLWVVFQRGCHCIALEICELYLETGNKYMCRYNDCHDSLSTRDENS